MSSYEEEVDCTEGPLVGVDIWGHKDLEVGEGSNHMVSAPNILEPYLTHLATVDSITTTIGDSLAQYSFVTPSPSTDGIWGFLYPDIPNLPETDLPISSPFTEVELTFISEATQTLGNLDIRDSGPHSAVDTGTQGLVSGVFKNIPEDAHVGDKQLSSSDSKGSSDRVNSDKGKQYKTKQNKFSRSSNFC